MSVQPRTVVHPDIRPENPPPRASHYIDAPNMPWESTKFPGIWIKVLYSDDSGITTALFKLEPGAVVPLHEHVALEQTYVIEGTWRTMKVYADLVSSCGARPATSTRPSRPTGPSFSAFSSSPTASPTGNGSSRRRGSSPADPAFLGANNAKFRLVELSPLHWPFQRLRIQVSPFL
jgi:hypothetical protein